MKHRFILLFTVIIFTDISCIRDEAPNAEADILSCTLPEGYISSADIDYNTPFDKSLNAFPLNIEVNKNIDLTSLSPHFQLTPGATISPADMSEQDFTLPVRYTVTSEDRKWHKTYSVSIHHSSIPDFPEVFHFDNADDVSGFYVFSDGDITWCSGNRGYRLTNTKARPDEYPTLFSTDGYRGGCAMLKTRTTGSLGQMGGMPIAAGNLFIGAFEVSMAMSDALAATRFGIPYTGLPEALEGWYKYTPGPEFFNDGKYTTEITDCGNIIAVFYERDGGAPMLDGHTSAEGWTDPAIVAIAEMAQTEPSQEWRHFHLDFDYERYKHTVDPEKLAQGKYSISLIFSSSAKGGEFKGAPGSIMMIDEVSVINRKDK